MRAYPVRNQQVVYSQASPGDRVPKTTLHSSVYARAAPWAIICRSSTFPRFYTPAQTDADLPTEAYTSRLSGWDSVSKTGFKCFPFDNFTYF